MIRSILFCLFGLVVLASCRSTRNIQTAITNRDTVAATVSVLPSRDGHTDTLAFIREQYQQVLKNRIEFTTFSGKIDVDYTSSEGKKYNVNAHLRMYKDSAIWISVTAILGIEGLRAYITKDSVKLLNKQDKVYTARSVSYLQEVTALPLNLSSLQDLLVGNPVFLDSNIISYTAAPGTISLQSVGDFFKNLFTINQQDKAILSSKLDDINESRSRTCLLTYADYETKEGPRFPTRRSITVSEKNKLDIQLDFKQYAFNETLSFPFSVPKNYKRE